MPIRRRGHSCKASSTFTVVSSQPSDISPGSTILLCDRLSSPGWRDSSIFGSHHCWDLDDQRPEPFSFTMTDRTNSTRTFFLQRCVFPGGELVHLDDVIREGERAGFTVVGIRDLRRDYALTCKAWVKRLQAAAARCSALVGERTYRTWLLYLGASAVAFEDHNTTAAQVLFMKPRKQ